MTRSFSGGVAGVDSVVAGSTALEVSCFSSSEEIMMIGRLQMVIRSARKMMRWENGSFVKKWRNWANKFLDGLMINSGEDRFSCCVDN